MTDRCSRFGRNEDRAISVSHWPTEHDAQVLFLWLQFSLDRLVIQGTFKRDINELPDFFCRFFQFLEFFLVNFIMTFIDIQHNIKILKLMKRDNDGSLTHLSICQVTVKVLSKCKHFFVKL